MTTTHSVVLDLTGILESKSFGTLHEIRVDMMVRGDEELEMLTRAADGTFYVTTKLCHLLLPLLLLLLLLVFAGMSFVMYRISISLYLQSAPDDGTLNTARFDQRSANATREKLTTATIMSQ